MKLLVVDDEVGVRSLLQIVLTEQGHEVRTAGNGQEACQVAEQWTPDLLVTDLRMPVMNGVEALKKLRMTLPTLKAILMTAYSDEEWIRQAQTMGVNAIISKPFDVYTLIGMIEDLNKESTAAKPLTITAKKDLTDSRNGM